MVSVVSTADDPVIITAIDRMRRNFIVGRWWCGVGRRGGLIDDNDEEIRIMRYRIAIAGIVRRRGWLARNVRRLTIGPFRSKWSYG